jgi:2-succinyl-6-hydroxy-2,4-cyclohexadiene-1-carboxylate synthase
LRVIRRVRLGAVALEFSDEGPRAKIPDHARRPPVVLLHGFTGSKESWLELREALSDSRRVVSIDLPGHGGTQAGPEPENCSMGKTAAMVTSLMADCLDAPRFSLVGYSMGGRLALAIALDHGSRVEKLVLESASPGIADGAERARRRQSDEELAAFVEGEGIEAFVNRWERLPLFDSLAALSPDKREHLRRVRLRCAPLGLALSLRAMGAGAQPWLGDRLSELAIPTLLIAGALDGKFARIAREMASLIPHARLEIIDGAGHVPHLEQSGQFNRVVAEFLNGAS